MQTFDMQAKVGDQPILLISGNAQLAGYFAGRDRNQSTEYRHDPYLVTPLYMELLFPDAAAPLAEASGSLLLLLASFLARLGAALALALPAFCVRARLRGMAIEDESEEEGDDGDGDSEHAGEEEGDGCGGGGGDLFMISVLCQWWWAEREWGVKVEERK